MNKEAQIAESASSENIFEKNSGAFFRKVDWLSFWITTLLSLAVYVASLAPTVTLEDSGELAVASDYLGVPHPPGYPIWTLLTWFFQWIFDFVHYHGHPNPAWSVALASAVFGAFACGITALLISRSGAEMLATSKLGFTRLGKETENLIGLSCGVVGGMLLALSPVLWSQSVIVEVYSLNALFTMWILAVLYRWMERPKDKNYLLLLGFLFGLGLTNHQSLTFMAPALVVAVYLAEFHEPYDIYIGMSMLLAPFGQLAGFIRSFMQSSQTLFRGFAILGLVLIIMIGVSSWAPKTGLGHKPPKEGEQPQLRCSICNAHIQKDPGQRQAKYMMEGMAWSAGPSRPGFWLWSGLALLIPALVAVPRKLKRSFLLVLAIPLFLFLLNTCGMMAQDSNWVWRFKIAQPGFWLWSIIAASGFYGVYKLNERQRLFAFAGLFALCMILTQAWAVHHLEVSMQIIPSSTQKMVEIWKAQYQTNIPIAPQLAQVDLARSMLNHLPLWFPFMLWLGIAAAIWGFLYWEMPNGSIIGGTVLMVELGTAFYLLMPIASDQNPPINWGYPRTWDGFMHAVTRGQYSRIEPLENLKYFFHNMGDYARQVDAIITAPNGSDTNPNGYFSVVAQFSWQISLLALIPFGFFPFMRTRSKNWLITSATAFIFMTFVFIVFQKIPLDVQNLFIGRVQYIQAHAVFAIFIAYGLVIALAGACYATRKKPLLQKIFIALPLLLIAVPYLHNINDTAYVKYAGSCEQTDHDFGWQFGNWQLRGVNGIKEDLEAMYSPEEFEKVWADYPDKSYPPEMDQDAIFFGGTDPGRFVPTYMIYSAHVREDVFLITQNALADHTYLQVMRDLMGDDIYIPSSSDSNAAFRRYVDAVQSGKIDAGAEVQIVNGRVSVQGVQGVMKINALLSREIFDANIDTHSFYIEESYPIPWMANYLTPHGLIMKINKEPVPVLSPELVKQDMDFWTWYTERLLSNQAFTRDLQARKSFSKLRGAIAGLYNKRRMYKEAERAFEQSIALYPLSPEANFRLADTMIQQRRFDDAIKLIEEHLAQDPSSEKAAKFLEQINKLKVRFDRLAQLESKIKTNQATLGEYKELVQILLKNGQITAANSLVKQLLTKYKLPPNYLLSMAQDFASAKQYTMMPVILEMYLQQKPDQWKVRLDLAAVNAVTGKPDLAIKALKKAIQTGGEAARTTAAADRRLAPLHKNPQFLQLMGRSPAASRANYPSSLLFGPNSTSQPLNNR